MGLCSLTIWKLPCHHMFLKAASQRGGDSYVRIRIARYVGGYFPDYFCREASAVGRTDLGHKNGVRLSESAPFLIPSEKSSSRKLAFCSGRRFPCTPALPRPPRTLRFRSIAARHSCKSAGRGREHFAVAIPLSPPQLSPASASPILGF